MEVSVQSKFLSLEDRLRAENETARNPNEKMTLDLNAAEAPFIRQGSGRRPGPRKYPTSFISVLHFASFLSLQDSGFARRSR